MVALSCMPCTDADNKGHNSLQVLMSTYLNHPAGEHAHDHSHDHEKDDSGETCPPLCQCNCCSITIYEPPVFVMLFSQKRIINEKPPVLYKSLNLKGYLSAIWQPPRFVS